ncbi:hypothetical protein DERF_000180 [Dermatophagoides farinae]|uniref:Uncharacterized protein n=1 Tax=Dermatophagoides farinae TaxID=6954 RepID=A0A922I8D0_DERFA|nr:hypothetical protein DERF_000180 [Dermatophagoides farinae]
MVSVLSMWPYSLYHCLFHNIFGFPKVDRQRPYFMFHKRKQKYFWKYFKCFKRKFSEKPCSRNNNNNKQQQQQQRQQQ